MNRDWLCDIGKYVIQNVSVNGAKLTDMNPYAEEEVCESYNNSKAGVAEIFRLDKIVAQSTDSPLGQNEFALHINDEEVEGWLQERLQAYDEVNQAYVRSVENLARALEQAFGEFQQDLDQAAQLEMQTHIDTANDLTGFLWNNATFNGYSATDLGEPQPTFDGFRTPSTEDILHEVGVLNAQPASSNTSYYACGGIAAAAAAGIAALMLKNTNTSQKNNQEYE